MCLFIYEFIYLWVCSLMCLEIHGRYCILAFQLPAQDAYTQMGGKTSELALLGTGNIWYSADETGIGYRPNILAEAEVFIWHTQ